MSSYYFHFYFPGKESKAWCLNTLSRITKLSYVADKIKHKFSDLKQDLKIFHPRTPIPPASKCLSSARLCTRF